MPGYKPTDTGKRDEIGLFDPLPCKILCSKGKIFSGGKLCKGRLTVYLCGFMTGEMEKRLVIEEIERKSNRKA
jgi:hypothetical protein